MTLAEKIFNCFKNCESFSLQEAYQQNADKPQRIDPAPNHPLRRSDRTQATLHVLHPVRIDSCPRCSHPAAFHAFRQTGECL